MDSCHSHVPRVSAWLQVWLGHIPIARMQPSLTAIQLLVLHAVALQRPLTLRLLPAHFQRCGPQGREHQPGGCVGHTCSPAGTWTQEATVSLGQGSLSRSAGSTPDPSAVVSTLTVGQVAHSPCNTLSRPPSTSHMSSEPVWALLVQQGKHCELPTPQQASPLVPQPGTPDIRHQR